MQEERAASFRWARLAYLLSVAAGVVVPVYYDIAASIFDAVSIHSKVMKGEVAAPIWRSFTVVAVLFAAQVWLMGFVLLRSDIVRPIRIRIPLVTAMAFPYVHDFGRDVNGDQMQYGSLNTCFLLTWNVSKDAKIWMNLFDGRTLWRNSKVRRRRPIEKETKFRNHWHRLSSTRIPILFFRKGITPPSCSTSK
jgi:hypothetical protein